MADTLFGYAGKILEVDLTTHSTKTVEVTPDLAKKYLGGVGFAAHFLWSRVKPGTDPLGPDNLLMFMTGPMTGTGASGTRWSAAFKSPHTGAWAQTAMGGDIGPELKYAGWDGIVIEGKADRPVWVNIINDKVTIEDAGELWRQLVDTAQAEIWRRVTGRSDCSPVERNHRRPYFALNRGSHEVCASHFPHSSSTS